MTSFTGTVGNPHYPRLLLLLPLLPLLLLPLLLLVSVVTDTVPVCAPQYLVLARTFRLPSPVLRVGVGGGDTAVKFGTLEVFSTYWQAPLWL